MCWSWRAPRCSSSKFERFQGGLRGLACHGGNVVPPASSPCLAPRRHPCAGGLLLVHVFGVLPLTFVSRLDDQIYDVRLRLTMPANLDERVAIVDIDEKSLAQLGHWPWGRDQLALLADRLFQHYGVAALGFDVLFSESDTSSGLASLQALASGPLRDNPAFRQQLDHLTP